MKAANFTLFGAILFGALGGCAPTEMPALQEAFTKPAIGQVATRDVGDPLFVSGTARMYDGLEFPTGERIPYRLGSTIEPLESFVLSSSGRYCGRSHVRGGYTSSEGSVVLMCLTLAEIQATGAGYHQGRVTRAGGDNFQQQIIYDGRVGNEVHFTYREFSGDLARPAFSQDLTFDLGEGATVGVKGARIEIISASNTSITYRLAQPFTRQAALAPD